MDICAHDKEKAMFCHGHSDNARALGHSVDKTFDAFKSFLDKNPREVVTIEVGDMTGKCEVIMPYLLKQFETKFGSMLVEHASSSQPWPTLQDMVAKNKRVVVFLGRCLKTHKNPPKWALNRGLYYRSSWHRTSKNAKNAKDVIKFAQEFCDKPNPKHAKHWRCMDFEYSPDLKQVQSYLAKFSVPKGICIADIAKDLNPLVDKVATSCASKFHVHRVRVDRYWETGKFIKDVMAMNKANVKKFIK